MENEGTAATISWASDEGNKDNENDYFITSRLNRETMYSGMLETYQKIMDNPNSGNVQKNKATDEIKKINDAKNAIMISENLIKTKGFEDVVILMNDESVSIVVKTEKLEEASVAQIQNIITREMKVKVEDINISSKN